MAAKGTWYTASGLARTGLTAIRGRTMDFLGPDTGSLPFDGTGPLGPVRLLGGRFCAIRLGLGKLTGKFRGAMRGDDCGSNVGALGLGCACRSDRAITGAIAPPEVGSWPGTPGPGALNKGFAEPGAPKMPAGERG